jgi:hypothetical protein
MSATCNKHERDEKFMESFRRKVLKEIDDLEDLVID